MERGMLALVKQAPGKGNVGLQEVPSPRPGPGQVMIRVEAAGICGSDLHIKHWDIKLNLRPPVIMGHEFCGVIEEVGEGVSGWQPGERVTSETTFRSCGRCRQCRTGSYNLCLEKELIGYVHDGCFAPYCVVPAERLHRLPEHLTSEEGALCEPLACTVHALMEMTTVCAGETVLVAGVGAIGLLSAQVVRASGARAIACGTQADGPRLAVAAQLGVERTVDVTKENAVEVARSYTDGEGVDLFVECSGAPEAARLGLAALRRGGRYCQIGLFGKPFELDVEQVAYKELQVVGSIGSKWTSWRTALGLLSKGQVKVRPLMNEPLPLSRWEEAFAGAEAKQGIKGLLRPVPAGAGGTGPAPG
jgi:L-iditol 2-dehydrogenase